jgi:hypothetical protein
VILGTLATIGDEAEDNRRADAWTAIRASELRSALIELTALDTGGPPRLEGFGRVDVHASQPG